MSSSSCKIDIHSWNDDRFTAHSRVVRANALRWCIRRALAASILASLAPATVLHAQQSSGDSEASPSEVVVTGTRIRRVDLETASPVFVIDNAAISASGVGTVGELMLRIPAISGAATNPQVNNGGGTGESNVELRGLGSDRTLVLINGHRLGVLGRVSSSVDVNLIPANLIDRVEVLKEGAGAIYGSDAIAGVVNFITRTDLDGVELGGEIGQTAQEDGERRMLNLSWGVSSDRLDLLVGANWSEQEEVFAGDRDFSLFALYLSSGSVFRGGSSRTPSGRIDLPEELLAEYGNCDSGSVTRTSGASGLGPADFRCFDDPADRYNFQPVNLVLTPQERASVFTTATYRINDSIESHLELIYNRTKATFRLAPLPFDAIADDVVISRDSYYNPFDLDLGGVAGANPNAQFRLDAIGQREADSTTDTTHVRAGLSGDTGIADWRWELSGSLGAQDQERRISGYLYKAALVDAVGPSGQDSLGNIVCGQPDASGLVPDAAIIPDCTPVNMFNLGDPSQAGALDAISTDYVDDYLYRSKEANLSVNGSLWQLPAGALQAAFGIDYRDLRGEFQTDFLTRAAPPLFLTCLLSGETCTGNSSAAYDVKELFGEFFVPLLKDLPGVHALNTSFGIRYSDYSTFGSTTNSQLKVEYRPIEDLLVRASYVEVFRAPTITDLSAPPQANAPTFADPCVGLTGAQVAANPNYALACENVPLDGTFEQPNAQIGSLLLGNPDLDPETGDVLTYGFVYDPSWLRDLSLTVDIWRYQIDDIITAIDPNFAINQCVATGAPQFCDLPVRFGPGPNAGLIQQFFQPTFNLGSLETNGVDFGVRYQITDTPIGALRFSLDMTRISSFENTPAPGAQPVEVAGTYDRQFGNYAQWRGLAAIGWSMAAFDGLISARYVGDAKLLNPDGALLDAPPLRIPSVTYVDLTLGLTIGENTKLQLGALNLADKEPPLLYQNNVINANTDVQTYDTIGRRYWVGIRQTF